jgi:hypothetical protein
MQLEHIGRLFDSVTVLDCAGIDRWLTYTATLCPVLAKRLGAESSLFGLDGVAEGLIWSIPASRD